MADMTSYDKIGFMYFFHKITIYKIIRSYEMLISSKKSNLLLNVSLSVGQSYVDTSLMLVKCS